jgi:hypothetical protein
MYLCSLLSGGRIKPESSFSCCCWIFRRSQGLDLNAGKVRLIRPGRAKVSCAWQPLIIGMHIMVNLLIEHIAMRRLGNTGDTLSFCLPLINQELDLFW